MSFDRESPFPKTAFKCEFEGSPFEQEIRLKQRSQSRQDQWIIALPITAPWDPTLSRQLITGLFAISDPLTLSITADPRQVIWHISAPARQGETIRRTIYAVYPQAELMAQNNRSRSGYYRFPLHLAAPYIFPNKEIEAFAAFDPLSMLLSAMQQLRPDERWGYELTLRPIKAIYLELGQQLITEWSNRTGYLASATLNVLQAKLNAPLKEVRLALKIRATDAQRVHQLAASSWPTWMQFANDGFNALAVPGPQTFQPVFTPGEVAALWHPPSEQLRHISGIRWSQTVMLPLPEPLKRLHGGIVLGTNTHQGQDHQARLLYADRDAHVNIIGKTGTGKSTLLHHMIHQDIEAGKGVALIDPHGDLCNDVLTCSISTGREEDVILLDTYDGEACPISLNPLHVPSGVQPYKIARKAYDLIRKVFSDDWPGPQTDRYFAAALRALAELPNTSLKDIPRLLLDKAFRGWVLTQITDEQALQTWRAYDSLNPGAQARIADPILNRLDIFLSDPVLQHILCQPDSLDFQALMDGKKIFLANLGAFQEEREANILGAVLLSKFQFAAMSRGNLSKAERQRKVFYLYIDELQRFVTASLPIIYDQARKYGLSLTGAFQRLSQLPGEDFKGIVSGVGATITFGTLRDDAKVLAPFLDERIDARALANLAKYTAVVSSRLDEHTLPSYIVKTQPPRKPRPDAPQIIARIRQRCQTKYGQKPVIIPNPTEERGNDSEIINFAG